MNKPDHISASQIAIGECLYKYKRIRLDKDIKNESPAMDLGSCVHEILHHYTDHCVKTKTDGDLEKLESLIDKYFNEYSINENEYPELLQNMIDFGVRGLMFDRILDYENKQTIEFASGKYITVIFDRTNSFMNGTKSVLQIIDYKNSLKIFSKTDIKNHLQLNKIYKYIACNFIYKNYDYVQVGIHHTRYNFTRWGELEKVNELGDEFENTNKFLLRQWKRLIESEKYEAKECSQCWEYGGCSVMKEGECPLYTKERLNEMKIGSIEEQVRALRKMKIDISDLDKGVKQYFKFNDPIEVDGFPVGYKKTTPSYEYLFGPFVEWCKEKDFPLDGVLSKTLAEGIIKKRVKMKELTSDEITELELIRNEKVTTVFKL